MKAYAIARWLVTLLDEEQRTTAREKISKGGVYSAFHGKWWPRITKSRGDYYGQIDALGTGRVVHLMEDILHLKIPLATMEGHRHLIEKGELRLPMLIEAPGIPDLAVTQCHFNRVAQYRIESSFERMEEDALWALPRSQEGN